MLGHSKNIWVVKTSLIPKCSLHEKSGERNLKGTNWCRFSWKM